MKPVPWIAGALAVAGASLLSQTVSAQSAGATEPAAPRYSFASLDKNGDGALGKDELVRFLPGFAMGFDLADRNGDGKLNRPEYEEALALSANMYGHGERSAHKRDIFRSLDMDGDRHVSQSEAQWRPEIAQHFKTVDRDGDGRLGVSEFGLLSISTLASAPAQSFRELDVDRDGRLSRSEFEAGAGRR